MKSLVNDPFSRIGLLKLPSGRYTESAEESLKHLLEVHFPDCSESPPTPQSDDTLMVLLDSEGDPHIASHVRPLQVSGGGRRVPSPTLYSQSAIVDILRNIFIASLSLVYSFLERSQGSIHTQIRTTYLYGS